MNNELMFLTSNELHQLTGRRKRPLQCEWLKQNNIPYTVNGRGDVNVLRACIAKAHGLENVSQYVGDKSPRSQLARLVMSA